MKMNKEKIETFGIMGYSLKMFTLACTRFNTETWQQNVNYREKHKLKGCLYGTPIKVRENIIPDSTIFVLEMNNDKNEIEGVGLVNNQVRLNKYYKIYTDANYNRFTYTSKYRIGRDELDSEGKRVFEALDCSLFKGARHSKRGHGIQALPQWIVKNRHNYNFIKFFRELFVSKYSQMPHQSGAR